MIITVTKENFEEVTASGTVLLDFWAAWCGPCRMVAPILEELAAERADITIGKIDVDAQMELAIRFGIQSIPTLLVYRDGEQKAKGIGYMPKDKLLALIEG